MKELQTWESLGEKDPLWAILSHDEKRGGKWNLEEFFKTGQAQVEEVVNIVKGLSADPKAMSVADFGCGVGRVPQNFAKSFDQATGIDISGPMIKKARELNSLENCRFVLNQESNLSQFADGTFDLFFSLMVLQHNRSQIAKMYIKEFHRVTKKGGLLYFQIPCSFKNNLKAKTIEFTPGILLKLARMLKHRTSTPFEMHCVPRNEVEAIITENDGELIHCDVQEDVPGNYVNAVYTVRKV